MKITIGQLRKLIQEELLREGPFRDIDKATTTIYNSLSRIKNSYQSIASDGDFKDAYGAFMKYYKTIRGSVLIKKFGDLWIYLKSN